MTAFLSDFLSNLAASAWAAGLSLVALAVVIWPLERLFPARRGQPLFRPGWWTDLAFFAGQYLVWIGLAAVVIRAADARIDPLVAPGLRAGFAAWPLPLQAVVVVMLGDISVYWFHRACHALPFLWRFHAVHHSAEHLDWLAAHREHPVDGLLTQAAVNAPAIVLGFSLGQIAWLIALRGMWAIFIHSNVRLPLGPLRVLLGAPELHHWHHLRGAPVQNFANLAPWTDLLFGTHHNPRGPETWPLGSDHPLPRSYLGMLARPLWPRLFWVRNAMRIQFRKLSDQQHELAIVRADGRREAVTCETRSVFLHDLLHYAVEGAARIDHGFWGELSRGITLAQMNSRDRDMPAFDSVEMATVEQFVGALHGAAKGLPAADVIAGIRRYVAAMDAEVPAWLTEALVVAVQERLRRLVGAWRATPHGGTMEVEWPPAPTR